MRDIRGPGNLSYRPEHLKQTRSGLLASCPERCKAIPRLMDSTRSCSEPCTTSRETPAGPGHRYHAGPGGGADRLSS